LDFLWYSLGDALCIAPRYPNFPSLRSGGIPISFVFGTPHFAELLTASPIRACSLEARSLETKQGFFVPPQDPETARWFAEHLQVHEAMLRAWLRSRFSQISDFDDIIQDAYSRVLAARALRPLHAPKAFFFATARNLAYDHFRKFPVLPATVLREFDELSVLDETVDIPESVARNQEIELMTQTIQSLPDRCRQVLTLRNVYGLSHKEIAVQLGISIRTVEAQVTVGIKRCTEFMAKFRNR